MWSSQQPAPLLILCQACEGHYHLMLVLCCSNVHSSSFWGSIHVVLDIDSLSYCQTCAKVSKVFDSRWWLCCSSCMFLLACFIVPTLVLRTERLVLFWMFPLRMWPGVPCLRCSRKWSWIRMSGRMVICRLFVITCGAAKNCQSHKKFVMCSKWIEMCDFNEKRQ